MSRERQVGALCPGAGLFIEGLTSFRGDNFTGENRTKGIVSGEQDRKQKECGPR